MSLYYDKWVLYNCIYKLGKENLLELIMINDPVSKYYFMFVFMLIVFFILL